MDNVSRAVALFNDGFLCSQAIVAVYGADFGLARETAMKLSAGFGGGMAGKGQACGAVTGAVMVLGLAMGHAELEDKASKKAASAAVYTLISRFEEIHATVNCGELLGCDLATPEGYAAAKEGRLFTTLCPAFVETAAKILQRLLRDVA